MPARRGTVSQELARSRVHLDVAAFELPDGSNPCCWLLAGRTRAPGTAQSLGASVPKILVSARPFGAALLKAMLGNNVFFGDSPGFIHGLSACLQPQLAAWEWHVLVRRQITKAVMDMDPPPAPVSRVVCAPPCDAACPKATPAASPGPQGAHQAPGPAARVRPPERRELRSAARRKWKRLQSVF